MFPRWSPLVLVSLLLATLVAGCLTAPTDTADEVLPSPLWARLDEQRLTPDDTSAAEVSIAADPTDPAHLVSAANSGGGFGIYVTTDAGASWNTTFLAPSDIDNAADVHGRFLGLSDPVVAFAADGTVHLAGLAYLPTSTVFVATSHDGGLSWPDVTIVHESDIAAGFNDKEWLGIHPETGTMVMTWQKEPALDSLRTVESHTGVDADIGDIVYARSTDDGTTWTAPVKVSRGMHNNGTQVAVTGDGTWHMLWLNYGTGTLDHITSTDDGVTWTEPQAVAEVQIVPPYERYSRMHTLPALAADPNGTALYAVWHDDRNADADIYAVASPDGGATWTDPIRVNQDDKDNGAIQLYPWATVGHDGRLHVSFYDSRQDIDHPRFHYVHAYAGPVDATRVLTFTETGPVTDESATYFVGPDGDTTESHSFGDYTAIAATPYGIHPAWADGRAEATGIWSVRLALGHDSG